MPKSIAVKASEPIVYTQIHRVGEFLQEGFGGQVNFYNMFATSILPGEPFIYMGRLAVSKYVVHPGELGQVHFGPEINMIVDPSLAAQILCGDKVYFSYGLADSDYPGYATNVQPANGYFIGYATLIHDSPVQLDGGTGKPISCTTSQARVSVLMHQNKMVKNVNFWGTVYDGIDGDTVISS